MGSQSGLRRSNNGMIAGVCGGIAESLNVDPTIVRLVYVLVSFFSAGVSRDYRVHRAVAGYAAA